MLAGSKKQRKDFKVPIAQTSCGQDQWILWQITIGMDEEKELPKQEITGDYSILRPGAALILYSVGSV